ncbi:dihydrolipoamide acetyltransferase family protein [Sphingomonas sp.]|uniref:dihydrolipoamide acetyltransferase family protein n=1 Tax=Sphingomonas sp. TaxID=28214 RepID=UPI0025F2AE74|nr:dihydrolipoamide acetyltransferase family protein [Sphingomonas sp.]
MARFIFKLPDIGEGIAEAEIVAWHVKLGDRVEEDQQLADMMTDKATVEMESPVAGTVVALAGEVGDQVAIGASLVEIETDAAVAAIESKDEQPLGDGAVHASPAMEQALPVSATEQPKPFIPSKVEGPRPEPSVSTSLDTNGNDGTAPASPKTLASPAVRQRARDLGIDLAAVKTTADRIRHADLDAYLLYNGGTVSGSAPKRPDETTKVVGLRRKIAENMAESKRRIPHFTLVEEFDVTDLEATRAMMNRDRGDQPKLTLLPFLITAMGRAIADWPMLNATFDDDNMMLTRHGAMHLGMATQTPGGLMVPVIRDAQTKSVWQLARDIGHLANAAKTGKATRDELTGSTITLSSLGPMGGITSTPVINRPEVAIIAVNKVQLLPAIVDGEIEARKRMNLSLSCDHRVVDGWDAASFLQAMKALIENPIRLLSA